MFQRMFVIGMLGVLVLIGGCSLWSSSTLENTPATGMAGDRTRRPDSPVEVASDKADKTKQVTIAVSGMT